MMYGAGSSHRFPLPSMLRYAASDKIKRLVCCLLPVHPLSRRGKSKGQFITQLYLLKL